MEGDGDDNVAGDKVPSAPSDMMSVTTFSYWAAIEEEAALEWNLLLIHVRTPGHSVFDQPEAS